MSVEEDDNMANTKYLCDVSVRCVECGMKCWTWRAKSSLKKSCYHDDFWILIQKRMRLILIFICFCMIYHMKLFYF